MGSSLEKCSDTLGKTHRRLRLDIDFIVHIIVDVIVFVIVIQHGDVPQVQEMMGQADKDGTNSLDIIEFLQESTLS